MRLPENQDSTFPEPAVSLSNLTKRYSNGVTPLEGVSFNIQFGEIVVMLGPSGCGKSTLLRLIAGLTQPSNGQVRCTRPAHKDAKSPLLAYIPQDATLLPWLNVQKNVELPMKLMGVPSHEFQEAAKNAIELVGLGESIRQFPDELSGGMKMRVSLARALVQKSSLILMDEPLASLDSFTRNRLQEDIRRLHAKRPFTAMVATHSINEAVFLADRILFFSNQKRNIEGELPITFTQPRDHLLRESEEYSQVLTRAVHIVNEINTRSSAPQPLL